MDKKAKIEVLLEAFAANAFTFNANSGQVELDTSKISDTPDTVLEQREHEELLTVGIKNTYVIAEGTTMANKAKKYTKEQLKLIGEVAGQLITAGHFKKDPVVEAAMEGNSVLSGRTLRFKYEHIDDGSDDVVVEVKPLREAEEPKDDEKNDDKNETKDKSKADAKKGDIKIIVKLADNIPEDAVDVQVEQGGAPASKTEDEINLDEIGDLSADEVDSALSDIAPLDDVKEGVQRFKIVTSKPASATRDQRRRSAQLESIARTARNKSNATAADVITEGAKAGEMDELFTMWGRLVKPGN